MYTCFHFTLKTHWNWLVADDTQLCVCACKGRWSFPNDEIRDLLVCCEKLAVFLLLNSDNTKMLVIGPAGHRHPAWVLSFMPDQTLRHFWWLSEFQMSVPLHTCLISSNFIFHPVPSALRMQGCCLPPELKRSLLADFFCCTPSLWNNLPADTRQSDSVEPSESKLKTHIFALTFS